MIGEIDTLASDDLKPNFTANNNDELRLHLRSWTNIPGRNEGRTKEYKEGFCLRLYLLALANGGLLNFPITVEAGERPDFVLHETELTRVGVEITEITDPRDQREYTLAQQRGVELYSIGTFGGGSSEDMTGDGPSKLWREYVRKAISRKRFLDYWTSTPRLLLYSNSNADIWLRTPAAQTILKDAAREAEGCYAEISAIFRRTLIFDISADCRLLPLPRD